MLGLLFLVVLGIGFYAFIGLAPDAVVKSMLVLLWAGLILSIPASLIYQALR